MRIRRQTIAIHFLTKMIQLVLGQATFQKRPRIGARRCVPLGKQQVPAVFVTGRPPEMVVSHIIECGGRCESGNVPAQFRTLAIGLDHHGHGIPADIGANAFFQHLVAGVRRFQVRRNGIDVSRIGGIREVGAGPSGLVDQLLQQVMGSFRTFRFNNGFQGVQPFLGFNGIYIMLVMYGHYANLSIECYFATSPISALWLFRGYLPGFDKKGQPKNADFLAMKIFLPILQLLTTQE